MYKSSIESYLMLLNLRLLVLLVNILFPSFFMGQVYKRYQTLYIYIIYSYIHTKITCQQCSSVSEREEDFLDIDVALSGRAGLEEALKQMYCDHELLEGNNQYRCERCQCLVDAKRVNGV